MRFAYGIAGMALAVFATLIGPGSGLWLLSLVLIGAGGLIGYATKVQMTQMPELVAARLALSCPDSPPRREDKQDCGNYISRCGETIIH